MNNQSQQDELARLTQYANATGTSVVTSTANLDIKDTILADMHHWCKSQGNVAVLNSGIILSSNPASRDIQNIKTALLNKGIRPGRVYPATQDLISLLLANSIGDSEDIGEQEISDRQQYLRNLVSEAIIRNASDIHIQVRKDKTTIRMRSHGTLSTYAEWTQKLGREIAAVAFNKETDHATSHFNPLVPQDASMPLEINGRAVRLRLASVPAHGGFDMVFRILTTGHENLLKLSELGYTERQVSLIADAVKYPHGAIIVAGPTGSGKTTTLASCMEMIDPIRKLYSIEDPVEKVVEKATQVPVNTDKTDRSFASMGRAALRMDPDVIILGEMRDEDTASVMVRASITGHLVLTTVHTNSATGIITRLMDLGVSLNLLSDASVLRLLMFQRLIAKICPHCAIPLTESQKHIPHLSSWQTVFPAMSDMRAKGPGCAKCDNTGIQGRTVIAEVVWIDDKGREFIQQGDTLGWELYLKEQGFESYQTHAIRLAESGACDPLDVEAVVGKLARTIDGGKFDYRSV